MARQLLLGWKWLTHGFSLDVELTLDFDEAELVRELFERDGRDYAHAL